MEEKKEVQRTILPNQNNNIGAKVTEEELFSILKIVAPGTNLRTALDNALKTGKGALIAIENSEILPLLDGGFRINARFTPQRVVELTKLDGAIILSRDLKKINFANVLLTPESKIKTLETGSRHKAAERTAKQTGSLVIAISERRHEISLFYKYIKYVIKPAEDILRKANGKIQILEKQRDLFDKYIDRLNISELRNNPNLTQAIFVIQKGRIISKISEDLKKHIVELGNEGTLIKTRLKEIISGVEKETSFVIKDYTNIDLKRSKNVLESLSYDEIQDPQHILKSLAYESLISPTTIKGWRILSKTSLNEADIARLIKDKGSLGEIIYSNIRSYLELLGDEKAKSFKNEVEKIKVAQKLTDGDFF